MNDDLKELSKYECTEESDKDSQTTNSDDEIEEEIDIYLNNVNENHINNINTYLIQYPLRPKYRPYNFTNNIQKIYKCKNYNKLKNIKNNFSTDEDTYIFEYKLHENIKDDVIHESNTIYKDEQIDKNISRLISTSVVCEYITNCICVFQYNEIKKKKEIYMIPLKHIYQFKPCYDNIKFNLSHNPKNLTREEEDVEGEIDTDSELKKEQKMIRNEIGVKNEISNSTKVEEDNNNNNNKERNDNINNIVDENWTSIGNIFEPDSCEAHEIISLFTNLNVNKNMVLQSNTNFDEDNRELKRGDENMSDVEEIEFNSDGYLYINQICKYTNESWQNSLYNNNNNKEHKNKDIHGKNSGNNYKNAEDIYTNLNMIHLFSLTLDEQILKIMRMKNVQNFNEIEKIIKKSVNNDILINTLKTYCVNMLGLWVIKSKYLYKFLKCKDEEKKNDPEKKLKSFSYVDYKISVRNLLLVIIFKQVEPLLLKYINDKKEKNDSIGIKNSGIEQKNNISNNLNKKINSSMPIIMENFEKATNLPSSVLSEIFIPLCEYKYTGYFFKHKMDENFIDNNTELCLFFNEKWKNKMVKVAKIIQTHKNSKIVINDYKLDIRTIEKIITDLLYNSCLFFDDIYNKVKKELKNTNIDLQTFERALNNIAININNMWLLRIDNQSEFNKCRNAVINIYQNNHNSILSKNEIIQHTEKIIKSPLTIPDIYFRNILKEFCVHKNGKYLFKGNDQLKNGGTDI
ncbi:hypothetical protein YYG_03515 [Plasmodium vinckei petteri]|uniref:DNA-directed RNA polymerase III subunit RPC5, putative n=1 Tax=Plasmodium vinckei petteri TaxID=138298 RepID=W7AJK3_PLAVN|nr:hypothetical protein YYG_03515 [Plasmodium vinckei petteri]CAD2111615.1 DNA-directed RNA polymerase III subunit RPC5, putative [Plasmodium vinckei petteri]